MIKLVYADDTKQNAHMSSRTAKESL